MKLKYSLKGLDCANCAQKVQERVQCCVRNDKNVC